MHWDESDDALKLPDSTKINIGTGGDLQIYHDGSNSYLDNITGNLTIRNFTDDSDIIFQSDDGSGGVTEYFRVDGSSERTVFSKEARFSDNVILSVGSGQDLKLLHDGTNTVVDNFTGHLYFRNFADDQDIIFQSDDGSGGVETFFFLDGSHGGGPITMFPDNSSINFGTTLGDLKITHDGSNSIINNGTGALVLRQSVDDGDLLLQCDDGSGGTTAYITLDGSETEIHLHKPVGIGTTNPDTAYKLDVAGKVQVQSVLELDDVLTLNAISTPADPAAGKSSIYMDSSDGAIKVKINVGGTVVTRTIASYE